MMRSVVWIMMTLAGLALTPMALAQRPPTTSPSSTREDVVLGWDRSAMPGELVLWAPRTLLVYDPDPASRVFAGSHVVCGSATDPSQGRCPAQGDKDPISGYGEIVLRLRERRSGMTTDLVARGRLHRPMTGRACSSDYWSPVNRPLWSARLDQCGPDFPGGIGGELAVPASELLRLVAGRWEGVLQLHLAAEVGGPHLATYTFNLDFTITDYDAMAVFLPEYPVTTPNIGLDLRYDPLAHTVGGRKQVDMCLYDGLGSQSEYLGLTITDTSGRSPGPEGFSLWHESGGSDDDLRLDYRIELDHAGARRRMASGVEERLQGIDSVPLRLVMLPGMNQPVFCVPTPLLLTAPRVPITGQRPGTYEGALKIELRLPTSRP